MDIVTFGTPFGLAFASGLNAYLPLLAFALSVRGLHLFKVNPQFAFITNTWFIALLVILTLLDFIVDKIPFIDHAWNAVHSIIRPIAGAFVAIVASSQVLPAASFATATDHAAAGTMLVALGAFPSTALGLFIVFIVGGILAIVSHRAKSTTRLISTLTSGGFLNTILSLAENGLVVIIILLSLFASAIMLILLVILLLVLVPRILHARNAWFGGR